MKKSILAIAVAATMAAPAAAFADATVYGNVHLSLNAADNDVDGADNNLKVSSNTSAIGVKGSEDLGDGMKAFYKLEWQIGIGDGPDLYPDTGYGDGPTLDGGLGQPTGVGGVWGRDQFVGLKGGFGKVAFGTMSSNYKQMGGKIDPLYRTPLEGRGFLMTQSSALHGGKGVNRGRQTHTAQYTSPKMGGIELVVNTTFSGSQDETTGAGVRWSNKSFLVYLDWIDGQITGNASQCGAGDGIPPATACKTEAATKIGGQWSNDAFAVALQYEDADKRTGADYVFLAGTFNINANNAIIATYGMQDVDEKGAPGSMDTDGYALAYNHNMSKMTNVYVGYGAMSNDVKIAAGGGDESMFTAGIRKKF